MLRFFFKKSVGWFEAFILSSLKEMVGEKRMAKYMVQFHTTIFTSMAHITIVRKMVLTAENSTSTVLLQLLLGLSRIIRW